MVDEKRLVTLQEEVKLLKGEVKHSLASVRDYLLNSELPSAELSNLDLDQGEQKITMKGLDNAAAAASQIASDLSTEVEGDTSETPPEDEDLITVEDEESAATEGSISQVTDRKSSHETVLSEGEEEEEEAPEEPQSELEEEEMLPDEEAPAGYSRPAPEDEGPGTPPVNMLANLITWVTRAKQEIGYDQLPTFLEVYGLSGHLSPEMKDIILHFAQIMTERPDAPGNADIWSQSMLSLHGILTGGDAPLHPAVPTWTNHAPEEPDVEKKELVEKDEPPAPVKLKLVFPDGKGKEKEFSLDLAPEDDGHNGHKSRER
jgi:hypothetical protein